MGGARFKQSIPRTLQRSTRQATPRRTLAGSFTLWGSFTFPSLPAFTSLPFLPSFPDPWASPWPALTGAPWAPGAG